MLTIILALITWRSVAIGAGLFVITFSVSLAIVSIILVKIPPDYFKEDRPRKVLPNYPAAVRYLVIIGKNLLGVLLVAIGIVLSLPGVPGQGILTILLGIMLLDFPGRQSLERKIVSQPRVHRAIDKLRHRFGKPKLEL